jgi:transcriptional regulator with XRE-family HTH domain
MSSVPVPRRRLGRRLRAMRQAAGLTLEAAAPKLDMSTSTLNRLEHGNALASVHLVRSMMDVYDQFDPDVLDSVRQAREPGWWQGYCVRNQEYLAWEASAIRVTELAVLRLPDLLHTEDYLRALLHQDGDGGSERRAQRRLDDEVHVLGIRQRRLTCAQGPLALTAFVDEAALRRQVGSPDVMCAQLDQLARCSDWAGVTLRVLPATAGTPTGVSGGFSLLDFEDPQDPPLVYVEYPGGVVRERKAESVDRARHTFDTISSTALPPRDSVEFIKCISREVHRPASREMSMSRV